jgi:hypothetical protein
MNSTPAISSGLRRQSTRSGWPSWTRVNEKAEADTGGSVVNALAYKPEHISVRGSLDQVRRVEADKNCEPAKPGAPAKR